MIRIPWTNETAPNAMLEITNQCNLSCNVCYAVHGTKYKSIDEIKKEIACAQKLRKLDTITITGGEPLLHPNLSEIISIISKANCRVFLLTNGLLITKKLLDKLKKEGLDDILFHVDLGQERPDLPKDATIQDVIKKQEELIKMATSAGIDPSISFTSYDESGEIVKELTNWFLHHHEGTMLFISRAVDPSNIKTLNRTTYKKLSHHLKEQFNLRPFAYIESIPENSPPIWYSYFIPVLFGKEKTSIYPYSGTIMDRFLIHLGWVLKRRFTHRSPKSEKLTRFRVITNGLVTFRIKDILTFFKDHTKDSLLTHKIIAYDNGPHISKNGELVRCSFCPTAIIKDEKLIRCCEMQPNSGISL